MSKAKFNIEQKINQNLLTFICSMLLIAVGEYIQVTCWIYYALAYSVSLTSAASTCITLIAYTTNYCAKKCDK